MAKLAMLLALVASPAAAAEWLGDRRPMMGTEVSVYLWSDDAEQGRVTIEAVFQEVARIDRLMSTYKDESKISEINRDAAQRPVAAGDELFQLIKQSLIVSALSDGAFDITYDSVGRHYDFREGIRPDAQTIEGELDNIDYRHIRLLDDGKRVQFRQQGVRINLGGIAKGYAVERGVAVLRDAGIENGVVTAGGDSRLLGDRRGQPWMIGIKHPRDAEEVAIRVPLSDEAISTSGDYERYFEENGVRYHHIISTATGAPASGVRSASVFGPDAVMTDALSTSVFLLGVDKGLRLIGSMPDYESIVIDADNQIYYSDGLTPP